MPEVSAEQVRLSEELLPEIERLYDHSPEANQPWALYAEMEDAIALPPKPVENNVIFVRSPQEKPEPEVLEALEEPEPSVLIELARKAIRSVLGEVDNPEDQDDEDELATEDTSPVHKLGRAATYFTDQRAA